MWVRLRRFVELVLGGLWFVPSVYAVGGAVLAMALVSLDVAVDLPSPFLTGVTTAIGPDGARAILATIAGSSITVAGLIFSITMVVLNLASAQFGPRLVPTFLRRGGAQNVFGAYLATFIYSLFVLATVRGGAEGDGFTPQIATLTGVALGVLSFGLLIFFMHRVSIFIQAPVVVDRVALDLEAGIERMFPERASPTTAPAPVPPPDDRLASRAVLASRSGYLQAVEVSSLTAAAAAADGRIDVKLQPGKAVLTGETLAEVYAKLADLDEIERRTEAAFLIGPQRTATQDPEFAALQLVELALRALSPGINDPFTAINCIDRLAGALRLLEGRDRPEPQRFGEEGTLRVTLDPFTRVSLIDAAFSQIRQASLGHVAVLFRLLEVLRDLAALTGDVELRDAFLAQARALMDDCAPEEMSAFDRTRFEARAAAFANV